MANEVIDWNGGECPVEPDVKVDIKQRDGGQYFGIAARDVLDWTHYLERDSDIIAYRLHTPPPPM